MSKQSSPRYDTAFKQQAVEQVLTHHQSVAQVARQFHCSSQSVANWVKQYQNHIPANDLHHNNILPNISPHNNILPNISPHNGISPNHSPSSSPNPSSKPNPSSHHLNPPSSHPIRQAPSCQRGKESSHCFQATKPPPRRTTFLPVEVIDSEVPASISSLEAKIEIITKSGLTLRFPGETALAVLTDLVRQLELSCCDGGTKVC